MSLPIILDGAEALESAIEDSHQKPVFVFKHSLTCPISAAAWKEYGDFIADHPAAAIYTAVEIQRTRELSALVAEKTQVEHESPQVILLRDGKAVWHRSHGSITEDSLTRVLDPAGS